MITGFEGSFLTPDLLNELFAKTEPLEYEDFGSTTGKEAAEWLYPISKVAVTDMGGWKDYKLDVTPDAPLCEVFRNPYFRNDLFFYPDELLGGVPVYKRKTGTDEFILQSVLSPTDDEKDRFVSISRYVLNMMKADGGVHYIICNSWMLDSTHIGMSYSLPRIFEASPGTNSYFNQPCILSRRVSDCSEDSCTALDFDVFHEKFMYKHFQFCSTGDKIIVGCWKMTWPIEFETEELIIDATRKNLGIGYVVKSAIQYLVDSDILEYINIKEELPKMEINLLCINNHLTNAAKLFIEEEIINEN